MRIMLYRQNHSKRFSAGNNIDKIENSKYNFSGSHDYLLFFRCSQMSRRNSFMVSIAFHASYHKYIIVAKYQNCGRDRKSGCQNALELAISALEALLLHNRCRPVLYNNSFLKEEENKKIYEENFSSVTAVSDSKSLDELFFSELSFIMAIILYGNLFFCHSSSQLVKHA